MTLDEAIKQKQEQAETVAQIARSMMREYEADPDAEDAAYLKAEAEEHWVLSYRYTQIADWLMELQTRRAADPPTTPEVVEREPKRLHRAPIIAVDFDGTLCENTWPGIGPARTEMLQAVKDAQAAGAKLILWTNRVGPRLTEAVDWCADHGLRFDAVNENLPQVLEAFITDCRKVVADIYLDDKAVPATPESAGALCDMLETIKQRIEKEDQRK